MFEPAGSLTLALQGAPATSHAYGGTPQTVRVMIAAAKGSRGERSMAVRRVAEMICAQIRAKAYADEALGIYYWVVRSTRYTHDPKHVEMVRDPTASLEEIQSRGVALLDCDDLATLLAALCMSVGMRCWFCTVDFRPCAGDSFSHVFCVAEDPKSKTRIVLDPVAGPKTASMLSRVRCFRLFEVT